MGEQRICPNCGHIGWPATVTKGSLAIAILLWLLFLIPGLIYTLWRRSSQYEVCAKCNAANLIPIDSPRGLQLAQQFHGMDPTAARAAADPLPRGNATRGVVYLVLIVLAICYAIYALMSRDRDNGSPSATSVVQSSTKSEESAVDATRKQAPAALGPVSLKAGPVTATNRPIIAGTTNLPDGTELMVSVSGKRGGYTGSLRTRVSGGHFETEPFTSAEGPLLPGTYTLAISIIKNRQFSTAGDYKTTFKVPSTAEAPGR